MNYFDVYGSHELSAIRHFIEKNDWLKSIIVDVVKDSTPLHDAILVLKNGTRLTVEIKEDEKYWFLRTGNIGLDYISSFSFNTIRDKYRFRSLWVDPSDFNDFINCINVRKYGKLITCDADLQFYFVINDTKDNFIFAKLYNNSLLQNKKFVDYLNRNYRLRINDKGRYGLNDSWESAAYFVNPLKDGELKSCEINNLSALDKITN